MFTKGGRGEPLYTHSNGTKYFANESKEDLTNLYYSAKPTLKRSGSGKVPVARSTRGACPSTASAT